MPNNLEQNSKVTLYKPGKEEEQEARDLANRVEILKDSRRRPLMGSTMSVEDKWREADLELTPHELEFASDERKRFESDDELGLRSRMVKVGEDDNWQSNVSSADFYVKVATAVSILTDMNPEAVFMAASRKYEKNTLLAYANWKRSWENSGARQQMKLFTFNLAKYGFAVGRTFPRIVETQKKIFDPEVKDGKYKTKRLVKYNDLSRINLNPWQVWISDSARIGDSLSVNDWYYEMDFDEEVFHQEFPTEDYPNAAFASSGMVVTDNPEGTTSDDRQRKITVGFYENQVKDKYVVWVPSAKIILSASPLPNDDGMLSLWFAPWTIRDDRSIYGIGIFEIIRNDKYLYDKLSNMTMDQLALSIYKMFFYKGVDRLGENGKLVVSPGVGEQSLDPQAITWMNVPGPGMEAWKGMEYQKALVDDNSGVPMQLSGRFAGKTLGQDIAAKETALERLRAPLDFICDALQQEAYISLSWIKQIYSTPEILEWTDESDLAAALEEAGLVAEEIAVYLKEARNPQTGGELLYQEPEVTDEDGNPLPGKKIANVYRENAMNVGRDDKGELFETEDNRFYRFGIHFSPGRLDWRGVISIKPQSILKPSKELAKRNDLDLFNLVFPSIQAMAANPLLIPVLMPPIKQIINAYDKDPKEWIDQKYFEKLYGEATQPKETVPEVKTSLSVAYKDLTMMANESQKEVLEKYLGIKIEEPMFITPGSVPGQNAVSRPGAPASENPAENQGMNVNLKEGVQKISPVADLKPAPTTMGGAIEGAVNMV